MALTKQAREFFVKEGRKGAEVTNAKLSPEQRRESARHAAEERWKKEKREKPKPKKGKP